MVVNDVSEFFIKKSGETYLLDPKGNVLKKKSRVKSKLVHGVGVNDWKYAVKSVEGGISPAYDTWKHMLKRGYSEKYKAYFPTYIDVSVSDEWFSFTTFFSDTKSYMKKGYQLDKDLLFFGNKIYSKENCIFVPPWLNSLLLDRGSARGDLPQGVCWHKSSGNFSAQCTVDGGRKYIGNFRTSEEASEAYVNFKLDYIESKRVNIEVVALHNDLHLRMGSNFSLTDCVIDNFKKQVMIF